uniref:VWFA domain-containing protein n=1 Tax=Sander lucioperca TaxID=283035 RepID=A0A8C9XGW9_SANLU
MVDKFNVDENKDHVSVVQYSRTPSVEFFLNTYKTQQDVAANVQSVRYKGGTPLNTGAALHFVKDNIFTASSGSRHQQGVPQILVLLTGGRSSDDVRNAAENLRGMGVMVCVVGTKNADTLEIQSISQEASHAFFAADSSDLSVCLNACVITDPNRRDIVFLLDGSDGSQQRFPDIKDFVLNLDENRDRVAVVQYSRDATVNFYLNSYSSKNDVLNSIRTIRHKLGRPLNIGKALEFVRDNVFAASVGGRRAESVPQYLYVFSGGRSGDDVRGPAQSLKGNGIKTFTFGTENADTLEMQTISFTPAHNFHVTSFHNLHFHNSRIRTPECRCCFSP